MDTSDIRLANIRSILSTLRFSEGMTKRELAEKIGLSFSTVSNTCNALQEAGILSQRRHPTAGAGRFPNQVRLNSGSLCSVCIQIRSADALDLAVVSLRNDILYSVSCDIRACETARAVFERALCGFAAFRQEHPEDLSFIGLAVSVPGIYDEQRALLMYSPLPVLNNAAVGEIAGAVFSLPCYVNSASNYCAIDMQRSVAKANNFIYIHLAEEITTGIISQSQLVTGQHGHAPRIGHLPLGDRRKKCSVAGCRGYGCLETELSLYGMVENYVRDIPASTLRTLWAQRVAAVREDPVRYRDYLAEKGGYIGVLLGVLVNLLDPAVIVIGGDCAALQEELGPIVQERLEALCPLACSEGLAVEWDGESCVTIYRGMMQVVYENWTPLA